jgi:hypothetical protein
MASASLGVCHDVAMESHDTGLGEGRLSVGRVLGHAKGMLRIGFRRIVLVALVIFVPPSILAAVFEHTLAGLESDPSALFGLGMLATIVVAATFRLLGPVVFAGYLDEAVGSEYFHGHQRSMAEILRSLPWGRLLVADLVVMGGTVLLTASFVLPGFAFYMLFGLVGPVLVQERRGLRISFIRTFRISLTALLPIALLVLVPTIIELTLHELVFRVLHGAGLGVELLAEWLLAAIIGGGIGVIEVALATELMVRNPQASPTDAHGAEVGVQSLD